MILALAYDLFEVKPQVGGELGMHQRLHKNRFAGFWWLQPSFSEDHFQRLNGCLFAHVGHDIRHSTKPIDARCAGSASQQISNAVESSLGFGAEVT